MTSEKTILGLDLGTGSIGWALIRRGEGSGEILAMGSRVFPEGIERDKTGGEVSRNLKRRQARGARRTRTRRIDRRRRMRTALTAAGLLPAGDAEFAEVMAMDPYRCRAEALNRALAPFELGRALMHLNQRRGFRSNRKTGSSEDGVVYDGIHAVEQAMQEDGSRTLGEYLDRQARKTAMLDTAKGRVERLALEAGEFRVRGRYTHRRMIEAEFDAIWAAQRPHHPALASDELRETVRNGILLFQRSFLLSPERARKLMGACPLEPEEARCPRSDWHGQEFRILKEVANLRLQLADGGDEDLPEGMREWIVTQLHRKKKLTFEQIRRKFDLPAGDSFNLELGEREYLEGHPLEVALSTAFGKRWDELAEEDRQDIRAAMIEVDDDDALFDAAVGEWQLSEDKAKKLLKAPMPDGYFAYSKKAILRLLTLMDEGTAEFDAIKLLYPEKQTTHSQVAALPAPGNIYDPVSAAMFANLRNPIVMRTLTELRKVVNAIIARWGLPDEIRLELTRDMQGSSRIRADQTRKMRERERENEAIRERIREHGYAQPSREDIAKVRLWQEQREICAYTGRPISFNQLLSSQIEVDHILPYSLTLDDSMNNKVVCFADANREKGQRTPVQWLGKGTPAYEKMMAVVEASKMEAYKRERFTHEAVALEGFIERQLSDTRYATKIAAGYLRLLYPVDQRFENQAVTCTRGGMTARLRHHWGISKSRDDHRHHAVDALVVALTDSKTIRSFASAFKRSQDPDQVPPPWADFRADVERAVADIVVSHRVHRKLAGGLHEETFYGPGQGPGEVVVRVGLDRLTFSQLGQIRDEGIRRIIRQRLRDRGIDPDDKKAKWPNDWHHDLRMPSGVPIKSVRIARKENSVVARKVREDGTPWQLVKPGANHHIAFFRREVGGKVEIKAEVVTQMEAAARARRRGEPIVNRNRPDLGEFWFSLGSSDTVEVLMRADAPATAVVAAQLALADQFIFARVQNISLSESGFDMVLRPVFDAAAASQTNLAIRLTSLSAMQRVVQRKIAVCALGSPTAAND